MEPIIVTGMHRSGTSLLTNILDLLDIHTGNDLDDNNESQFFCAINEWILFQAGAAWDNPYNSMFMTDSFINEIAEAVMSHLESKKSKKYHKKFDLLYPSDMRWAWKDPRNTFTYPVWLKLFPGARFINIYRNPIDVAESLRKREIQFQRIKDSKTRTGLKKKLVETRLTKKRIYAQSLRVKNIQEGVKLWEQYTSYALQIKEPCLHISYEDLLDHPSENLKKICTFLTLELTEETTKEIKKIFINSRKNSFIDNDDLIKEYRKIQSNHRVKKLNYHTII